MRAFEHAGVKLKPARIKYFVPLIFLCLFFYIPHVKALSIETADTSIFFRKLKKMPPQQRIAEAIKNYKDHYRKTVPVLAMHHLDTLVNWAHRLNDKQLECSVFEMRADYYSVNRGFNTLSTLYYQKAIDFAFVNNQIADAGIYLHKMGIYYFVFKQNVEACKYFLKALDIFQRVGFDKVPDVSTYLTQEAGFYYDLGDYDNAKLYLKEALKYPISYPRIKINSINTLGLICRNNKNFPCALKYFNAALKLSQANRDTAWVAIAMGNVGSVFFLQGQYGKALPLITTDYNISLKYGERTNAALALLRLVKISLVNNRPQQASKQLDDAEILIHSAKDGLKLRIDFYDLKAQLYERQGRLAECISYHKQMELAKDSLQQRNNIAAVERVKLGWEMANHETLIDKLKTEAQLGALKRNAIIMGLFFLIIISLLVYNQLLLKAKKDKNILLSEKQQVDEELKNAESELLIYTESLKRKNLIIESFKKEVDRLEIKMINTSEAEHLEKMMQAHIMTDENWDEFKALFAKVHTGFFFAIKQGFPGLSGTDTRILTLMKLQLSNREMANMLGITTDGIKKAKQRLRKKMNLPGITDIEQAIAAL